MSAVLLVDDNPADRALFRTTLSRAGFQVHEAAYGRDALARAVEVRPHAIVLDVNLPDTDGHAVCRALRADADLAGIPVLMLTVRDDQSDILAGLEAGADDYVAKDAAPEIVVARVRRLVRYRQMAVVAALNEQLAQVGRLLAGIVHEIRGPLSVIRGNADLMRMTLGEDHETNRWVDPILRNCQVLQGRLEHLMAAVRGGPPILGPLDVSGVVREATDLFLKGTDLGRAGVTITVEVAAGLPPVRADAGRMIQVLMNLLGNAREAILAERTGGRIVARVEARQGADGAEGIAIEVLDDGPGIPEPHLGRLFEPFFTTKADGSGYGLYLAGEILREHGGRLSACNRSEGGACFTAWLPAAPATSQGPAAASNPALPPTTAVPADGPTP